MGHTGGGQALMRSHRPRVTGGVGSTGHYQDNVGERVSRLMGSDPTLFFRQRRVGAGRPVGRRSVSGNG
jgi:hypothetical protein